MPSELELKAAERAIRRFLPPGVGAVTVADCARAALEAAENVRPRGEAARETAADRTGEG